VKTHGGERLPASARNWPPILARSHSPRFNPVAVTYAATAAVLVLRAPVAAGQEQGLVGTPYAASGSAIHVRDFLLPAVLSLLRSTSPCLRSAVG
jgi:hypothetical protein